MERLEWGAGEVAGDYRLLRRIDVGVGDERWLAAPVHDEDAERVELRLLRPGTARSGLIREAELLWRARGPHVVALRGTMPSVDGWAGLVLEHVPHDAAEAVAGGMRAGAAVTLLAPLADELRRLHRAGIVLGDPRLDLAGIDGSGRPVWRSIVAGGLPEGAPPTADELRQAAHRDATAFQALSLAVLGAVSPPEDRRDWDALLVWAAEPITDTDWLRSLRRRLLQVAAPEPIDLSRLTASPPAPLPPPPSDPAPVSPLLAGLRRIRARGRLGRVRARVWVPVAAVLALMAPAAMLVLMPGDSVDAGIPAPAATEGAVASDPLLAAQELTGVAGTAVVVAELGEAVVVEIRTGAGRRLRALLIDSDGWRLRSSTEVVAEP